MQKEMLLIRVFDGDETIGHLTTEEFRRSVKPPSRQFLSDTVAEFNARKEAMGEPERVEIVLNKG